MLKVCCGWTLLEAGNVMIMFGHLKVCCRDLAGVFLQGYLAHKKHPPPLDHNRSVGIGLL